MEPQENRTEQAVAREPATPPSPGYNPPPSQGTVPPYAPPQTPPGYQPYGQGQNPAYGNQPYEQRSSPGFVKRLYGDDGTTVKKILKVISYIFFCLAPLSFIGGIIRSILVMTGSGQMGPGGYIFASMTMPSITDIFAFPLRYCVYGVLTICMIKILDFLKSKK